MKELRLNISGKKQADVQTSALSDRLARKAMADRINNCSAIILNIGDEKKIEFYKNLIKAKMAEMNETNELKAAMELCTEIKGNAQLWILGAAGLMIWDS